MPMEQIGAIATSLQSGDAEVIVQGAVWRGVWSREVVALTRAPWRSTAQDFARIPPSQTQIRMDRARLARKPSFRSICSSRPRRPRSSPCGMDRGQCVARRAAEPPPAARSGGHAASWRDELDCSKYRVPAVRR